MIEPSALQLFSILTITTSPKQALLMKLSMTHIIYACMYICVCVIVDVFVWFYVYVFCLCVCE